MPSSLLHHPTPVDNLHSNTSSNEKEGEPPKGTKSSQTATFNLMQKPASGKSEKFKPVTILHDGKHSKSSPPKSTKSFQSTAFKPIHKPATSRKSEKFKPVSNLRHGKHGKSSRNISIGDSIGDDSSPTRSSKWNIIKDQNSSFRKAVRVISAFKRKITFGGESNEEEFLPISLEEGRKRRQKRRRGDVVSTPMKSICSRNVGKDIETGMVHWDGATRNLIISRRTGTTAMMRMGFRLWASYFFFVSLAISVQLVLGSGDWAFPDGNGCSNEEEEHINTQICNLSISLQQAVNQLYFLSPFILGGFLLSSVRLWQTRRTAYCMLCGATRNLLINLNSIISDSKDKRLVSRWAILGYELAVLKGRGLIDSDSGKNYLAKLNLLQGDEWETMVSGDRHTTIWFWIQMKAMKLTKDNVISQIEFQTICNAVTLSRDKANDLMSAIDRDQPSPYISLCAVLVNINLLLYSLSNGVDWAIWMHETKGGVLREPTTYIQVFCLFLYTTIYAMLFDVCGLLYNPFGPRDVDVNHFEVSKGIRKLANELSSRCTLPVTMDNFDNVESDNDESCLMMNDNGVSIYDTPITNPAQQQRESYMGLLNSSVLLKRRSILMV